MARRVLLLNPPGSRRWIRDYYCGEQSKGDYVFPPTDLLVMSGLLRGRHEALVLDAMAERLSSDETHQRIRSMDPHVIVSLASSASWAEDAAFFRQVRRYGHAPILVCGDLPRAAPDKVLAWNEALDGVVTDFTDCDLADYVDGRRSGLVHLHTREAPAVPRRGRSHLRYPVPQHERFPLARYHNPLMTRHPYTTVLTDYSCPFRCTFCPYERIPYKTRDLSNAWEELRHLQALGIRQILVNDASFGANRARAFEVCSLLSGFRDGFRWVCDMRVDHADPALLARMKAAGCEVVMFGVETPTLPVLASTRKGTTPDQARAAFGEARRVGLRTLAHFILGLDGETWETQMRLIEFALDLDPDYASFGVAVPAWGTTFRDRLVGLGVVETDATGFDVSGDRPLWDSRHLDRLQVEAIRRIAVRRFHLRPQYLLRRLLAIRTPYELATMVVQGLHVMRSLR